MTALVRLLLVLSYVLAFSSAPKSFAVQSGAKSAANIFQGHNLSDDSSHSQHSDSDCGDCRVGICSHHSAVLPEGSINVFSPKSQVISAKTSFYKSAFTQSLRRPPIA